MKSTTTKENLQEESTKSAKNVSKRRTGTSRKNSKQTLSAEQIKAAKAAEEKFKQEICGGLKAYSWKELETGRKFHKNEKLSFISDDMLIIGCDIGSETHYARAINNRGVEISGKAFAFSNSREGFKSLKDWALSLAVKEGKKQIVLGLEPTGHYWFVLCSWLISNGISVVQVNPYAVKQTKELEDNSQRKDDRKDPKLIANLVKDGNYGMPYLPEGRYAEIRGLSLLREQISEDRIRAVNRLQREIRIYFPEYTDIYADVTAVFSLKLLKGYPLPEDMAEAGESGLRENWKQYKLRGCGFNKAKTVIEAAQASVGLKEGKDAARDSIRWFAGEIERYDSMLKEVENRLEKECLQLPNADLVKEISGIGNDILAGLLSDLGDPERFDDAKELQKMSGLGLVENSSGKHHGQTKISHRGRKRLRYWLYQAARSVVAHAEEYREIHVYYTTRAENPLKKMQSLMVIACKLLRIIFTLLKTGVHYDPEKVRKDIRRIQTA